MNIDTGYLSLYFLLISFSNFCAYGMNNQSQYQYKASSFRVCFDCTNVRSLDEALNEALDNPHILIGSKSFREHYRKKHAEEKFGDFYRCSCLYYKNPPHLSLPQYQAHILIQHGQTTKNKIPESVKITKACPLCGVQYKSVQAIQTHLLTIPHLHDATKKLVAPLKVVYDLEQEKTINNKASISNVVLQKNVEDARLIDDYTMAVLWGAFDKK